MEQKISKNEGKDILAKDINCAVTLLLKPFLMRNNIKLTQKQFDALVSFTMNNRETLWNDSEDDYKTIRTYIQGKKYDKHSTKKIFVLYRYSNGKPMKGLKKRRKREARLFNGGKYIDQDGKKIF